jgi:hypothetical protein
VNLAQTRIIIGVWNKTVVRVIYSDECGTGGSFKSEPHTVVAAMLLNMDSQWIPVRDRVEAALGEAYGLSEQEIGRFVIKGHRLYQKLERNGPRADDTRELLARLVAIPRQELVPLWYGAVDRDGFKFQMENIHTRTQFKEANRPFMHALEECMDRVDTWVHADKPEESVIWIHDEGSLNERARETLRGFRWLRKESELAEFDQLAIMPEAHVSHIADMIYFGDDEASRLLQLVDVCCCTIARALRNDPLAAPYYEILRRQVQNDGVRPAYENARRMIGSIRRALREK